MGDTRRVADIASLKGGCDIYIGTVGRLCDFVSNGEVRAFEKSCGVH